MALEHRLSPAYRVGQEEKAILARWERHSRHHQRVVKISEMRRETLLEIQLCYAKFVVQFIG